MSFRASQIYVQARTRFRLRLLANCRKTIDAGDLTPDEIADVLINDALDEKYPELKELETEIVRLEQATAEAIKERVHKA